MAQLAEWMNLISEVCGSNPIIGKVTYLTCLLLIVEKTKIKKKRPGMAQ